jgi:BirA family biotin operon repressor/biotin-[acetyl-CoA-carboxylase] ligase
MILRPKIETDQAAMLTLVVAMATERAIEEVCQASPMIKWPNDIVLNQKKICGILTEMQLKGTEIDYVVVGIGINVNNQDFPEEISHIASSLSLELGKEIDRELLITEVWKQFAVYYNRFLQTKDISLFKEEYENVLVNKNKRVKVLDPLGEYIGIADGVTKIGELIVDTEGEKRYVSSGEVSVRGIYGYV